MVTAGTVFHKPSLRHELQPTGRGRGGAGGNAQTLGFPVGRLGAPSLRGAAHEASSRWLALLRSPFPLHLKDPGLIRVWGLSKTHLVLQQSHRTGKSLHHCQPLASPSLQLVDCMDTQACSSVCRFHVLSVRLARWPVGATVSTLPLSPAVDVACPPGVPHGMAPRRPGILRGWTSRVDEYPPQRAQQLSTFPELLAPSLLGDHRGAASWCQQEHRQEGPAPLPVGQGLGAVRETRGHACSAGCNGISKARDGPGVRTPSL